MATDTNLTNLVINELTKSQYNEALASNAINDDELYLITDDDTMASKVYADDVANKALTDAKEYTNDAVEDTLQQANTAANNYASEAKSEIISTYDSSNAVANAGGIVAYVESAISATIGDAIAASY